MPCTFQSKFRLELDVLLPFLDIAGTRAVLEGLDEDDILDAIATKELHWAFDIRTRDAARLEVRVFTPSIRAYQQAQAGCAMAIVQSVEDVVSQTFRHNKPIIRASEFYRQFNCSSAHVHNLIFEGSLVAVPGTGDRVNQTQSIRRESVISFLKERQL
jgi:hypothetical protein